MHNRFTKYLITFIFVTNNVLFTQSTDSVIDIIKLQSNHIKENLKSYEKKTVEFFGESAEGGEATAFFESGELKLIIAVWCGETGKKQTEYYFHDGELVFSSDQIFNYNRPIYWNKKTAKENGDIEVYDPEKTTVKENRYYFDNEKLFLWVDNNQNEVDLTTGNNSITGKSIVVECYKMIDKLIK